MHMETTRTFIASQNHRHDRQRQQATQFSVPCTCGQDVDIDEWEAHRNEAIAARVGATPEQVAGVRAFADRIGWTR